MNSSGCYLGSSEECNHLPDCGYCKISGNQAAIRENTNKNCPVCGEGLTFPRGQDPYCEDCGWPDCDFDADALEAVKEG